MPDYQNGKIYKLWSPSKNLVYYGSTTQLLSSRLSKHVWCFKNNSNTTYSNKILECDDYKIELVENYPCNNRHQLERRECEYVQSNECVNTHITGKTKEEIKDNEKKYRENNRDRILEYKKQQHQINKEKEKEQNRVYRENNKDKRNEWQKNYYQNNKDRILERQKNYYENNRDKKNKLQREYRARLKLKKSDVIVNG